MNEILLAQIQMQLSQIQTMLAGLRILDGKMDSLATRFEQLERRMLMVNIVNAAQGAQLGQAASGSENTLSGVNAQGAASLDVGGDLVGRDKKETT